MRRLERAWWALPFWLNAVPAVILMALDILGGHGTNVQFLTELRKQRDERRRELHL